MRKIVISILMLCLPGCAELLPEPFEPSPTHINTGESVPQDDIPALVQQVPVLPEPEPVADLEKYTVVVNEVPVKELLFALGRDAKINMDIDPRIEGVVTLNAVEQTLPQLLDRITRQVDLRYEFKQDNLIVMPDDPYFRTYSVGYLNLSRETSGTVTVSTQIASTSSGGESGGGGGGGGNTSTTSISSESDHHFWESLTHSINSIISAEGQESAATSNALVVNPESGIISVRATARQHEQIQRLIDQSLESVNRQVLIQATVVEVDLSDQYQAGIDWSAINLTGAGFSAASKLLGASITGGLPTVPPLTGPPVTDSAFVLNYTNPDPGGVQINAAISLLSEFGNTKVLSSPQIMVLNNHTAVLKVVENFVYFEVEQTVAPGVQGSEPVLSTTTTAQTIPAGLVMTVTPQISRDDSVTFKIRPTLSSVIRTAPDPNPALLIPNPVPVVRVREMESILKVNSHQIAVLGGLMQDTYRNKDKKTPFVADLPFIGDLFKARSRESIKTELVIFIRPVVIKNASVEGDLKEYKQFLQPSNSSAGMSSKEAP
ncbi:MAG: type II secretion system protein GspD [Gammaproteobacteria bacterium]